VVPPGAGPPRARAAAAPAREPPHTHPWCYYYGACRYFSYTRDIPDTSARTLGTRAQGRKGYHARATLEHRGERAALVAGRRDAQRRAGAFVSQPGCTQSKERELCIDNLLIRINFIILMMR